MTDNEKNSLPSNATAMEKFRYAFAIGEQYEPVLEEDEIELLRDIASTIHRRRLTPMAMMLLHINRPLNTLGANMVQMGEVILETGPVTSFLRGFMGPKYTHERLVRTMEKRCSVDKLMELLEELANERL